MSYTTVLATVWIFLPALVANAMPIFATRFNWVPQLNIPIDRGVRVGGERLFGRNKTVRGFMVGVLAGAFVGGLQFALQDAVSEHFELMWPFRSGGHGSIVGAYLGLAALTADATKSFVKRRLHYPAGATFVPWDQIDVALGGVTAIALFVPLTFMQIVTSVIVVGVLMFVTSAVGVLCKIKKKV